MKETSRMFSNVRNTDINNIACIFQKLVTGIAGFYASYMQIEWQILISVGGHTY